MCVQQLSNAVIASRWLALVVVDKHPIQGGYSAGGGPDAFLWHQSTRWRHALRAVRLCSLSSDWVGQLADIERTIGVLFIASASEADVECFAQCHI